MRRDSGHGKLYISDNDNAEIDVYDLSSLKLIGQITNGIDLPEGVAVDKNGSLYVTNHVVNGGPFGNVTVYPKGALEPSLTIPNISGPSDVAVSPKLEVYVLGEHGNVEEFAPGATQPSATLNDSNLASGFGVGLDRQGSVYAVGVNASYSPADVKYHGGAEPGKNLKLNGLVYPAGVLIDNHHNIVVTDFELPGISVYPRGSRSPSKQIILGASQNPDRSALNREETYLYVPMPFENVVAVYGYPSGNFVKSFNGPNPSFSFLGGAAVWPPARN